MPFFTEQPCYCPACGFYNKRRLAGPSSDGLCGPKCRQEWEWRTFLSMMGKDYYTDPKRGAAKEEE